MKPHLNETTTRCDFWLCLCPLLTSKKLTTLFLTLTLTLTLTVILTLTLN